jgi:esterase/lipase superfamily enzyme
MRSVTLQRAAAVLVALVLGACASSSPPVETPDPGGEPPPPMMRNGDKDHGEYVEVEVFYATDRSRGSSTEPNNFYASGRGKLEYGVTGVSIPRRHKRGELESPVWWKLEFTEDPARHVVLLNVSPMTPAEFHSGVATRTSATGQRNVLVFVHGFNVTFSDAVRRTAQIAYDLQFLGAPITFSWPSQGSPLPLGYTTDETNVEWTEPHLKKFLLDLKAGVGNDVRIHLVAHSMGNRALTKVLRAIAAETNEALFSQVVLAAPDIDRDVFERDIATAVVKTTRRTTLYASSQDRALMFSKTVHTFARAGQSTPPLVFAEGMDTVDASGIDTSALGHSYIASEPLLLNDLFMLIRHDLKPLERNLRAYPPPPERLRYWSFIR